MRTNKIKQTEKFNPSDYVNKHTGEELTEEIGEEGAKITLTKEKNTVVTVKGY